jgi:hypothetical protein
MLQDADVARFAPLEIISLPFPVSPEMSKVFARTKVRDGFRGDPRVGEKAKKGRETGIFGLEIPGTEQVRSDLSTLNMSA